MLANLNFTLKDMNGHEVKLADFKGKPVMLNFWATDCPPCVEEIPTLDAFQRLATDPGLAHLKGMTKLYKLTLSQTNVTDAGLEHLAGLTALATLEIDGVKGITGPGQTILAVRNITNDDRLGSAGEVAANFISVDPDSSHAADICNVTGDPVFGQNRQVTGRKAPEVINAVYNRDNFWDGRANHNFNGFNPFGNTGNNGDGNLVNMTNSSLASQADGPPNNPVEMSCAHTAAQVRRQIAVK